MKIAEKLRQTLCLVLSLFVIAVIVGLVYSLTLYYASIRDTSTLVDNQYLALSLEESAQHSVNYNKLGLVYSSNIGHNNAILSSLTITLTQNNDTITASGTGLTGFAYFTSSADPTCDSTGTYSNSGATTTAMTDGHWVCFKAVDSNSNQIYAKLQIDLTAPTVTLTQNNNKITARELA